MSDHSRMEEQALSKVAEAQLSNQLDSAEVIDVEIHTDLGKIVQGQADSVSVAGEGLVTPQDLHVQEVKLQIDRVSINPLSLLFGKIELNQPVHSKAQIVLTEADINQNLNSDYIRSKLPLLELNVDGRIVPLKLHPPMELRLPGEGKMEFRSHLLVPDKGRTQQVRFTTVMYLCTDDHSLDDHSLSVEGFSFEEGQAVSLDIMVAFMEQLKSFVNSPYLALDGATFRIREMDLQQEKLILLIEAHVDQLPSL